MFGVELGRKTRYRSGFGVPGGDVGIQFPIVVE